MDMSLIELINTLAGLLGGLAIFIYGMNSMGEGLQKSAGEKLRKIIGIFTSNPIMGILVGALVTALIQSSSATTVMVVGFVGAGLMTLPQAIGVIMGANIGTTMTAWLVSIKIGHFALPIAATGFIFYFFPKNKKIKYIGQVIFSFGLLFIGLNTMGSLMKPLAKTAFVENLILKVSDYKFLGVAVGAVVTSVIQSSSASIAVLQKLSLQTTSDGSALLTLREAIPILFGSNIGTTVTALLASIGASISAKRAALAHTIFNVLGAFIFIWFIPLIEKLVGILMAGNMITENMPTQIAYSHTIFNIVNTVIWLPFVWLLARIVTLVFRGEDQISERTLIYIDTQVLKTPSIAMDLAVNELTRMLKLAMKMIQKSRTAFIDAYTQAIDEIQEMENTIDMLQLEIVNYLSKMLSQSSLTDKQSVRLTGLMHITHDVERIGDYCVNISKSAEYKIENSLIFSTSAIDELNVTFDFIEKIMRHSIDALENGNLESAKKVLFEEDEIDSLESRLRATHIQRLNAGECHPDSAITFIELIHNLERIADSCKNIAEAIIEDQGKQHSQKSDLPLHSLA